MQDVTIALSTRIPLAACHWRYARRREEKKEAPKTNFFEEIICME
jgi:hypothetical protein